MEFTQVLNSFVERCEVNLLVLELVVSPVEVSGASGGRRRVLLSDESIDVVVCSHRPTFLVIIPLQHGRSRAAGR